MGLHFGELGVRIRKVVYYTLSANDQRFWVKSISHGLPNLIRRWLRLAVPAVPSTLFSLWCIKWSLEEHERSFRKDPKMYENDT